mmetsp:Transcript_4303/g.7543  ORF Transcript_4303/g.7543 Transcript_4303/m.7543 type:complete len:80 (-) Transcript_4303:39-278(-)
MPPPSGDVSGALHGATQAPTKTASAEQHVLRPLLSGILTQIPGFLHTGLMAVYHFQTFHPSLGYEYLLGNNCSFLLCVK